MLPLITIVKNYNTGPDESAAAIFFEMFPKNFCRI
jgi:hypothetical protein